MYYPRVPEQTARDQALTDAAETHARRVPGRAAGCPARPGTRPDDGPDPPVVHAAAPTRWPAADEQDRRRLSTSAPRRPPNSWPHVSATAYRTAPSPGRPAGHQCALTDWGDAIAGRPLRRPARDAVRAGGWPCSSPPAAIRVFTASSATSTNASVSSRDRPAAQLPGALWSGAGAVIALLVVQALATLYLPELNADIINNGVAKGDTAYIICDRRGHARVSLLVVVASIVARLLRLADRDGLRARHAWRHLPPRRVVLAGRDQRFGTPRSSPATRTTSSRSRWSS